MLCCGSLIFPCLSGMKKRNGMKPYTTPSPHLNSSPVSRMGLEICSMPRRLHMTWYTTVSRLEVWSYRHSVLWLTEIGHKRICNASSQQNGAENEYDMPRCLHMAWYTLASRLEVSSPCHHVQLLWLHVAPSTSECLIDIRMGQLLNTPNHLHING